MGKQTRKGPRRAKKDLPLDEELSVLASVLAEYKLDNNALGWFRLPWRDGLNAATLALTVGMRSEGAEFRSVKPAGDKLRELIRSESSRRAGHRGNFDAYTEAGEVYRELVRSRINVAAAHLIAAGARCFQLCIANSHGGGEVYNEHLIAAFLSCEPAAVEESVLMYRCIDALGIGPHNVGDKNDRLRSAFTIAWRRGLYLAAYSIKPPEKT